MSQRVLSSTGCWLARYQSSPATHFLHQYRRTLMTLSAPSTTCSVPKSSELSYQVPPFLLPLTNTQPARRHRHPPRAQILPSGATDSQICRFSTTPTNRATTVSLNPRTDDDGNEMTVKISSTAAKRLRHITSPSSTTSSLSKDDPYDHLRVTVSSGGCHGFQYLMSLDPASKIDKEEDTVFEADLEDAESTSSSSGETRDTAGEAKVVMDSASLEILHGSTVDYTVELIGSQFKIVDNPRASSNCGCGTSFDVK